MSAQSRLLIIAITITAIVVDGTTVSNSRNYYCYCYSRMIVDETKKRMTKKLLAKAAVMMMQITMQITILAAVKTSLNAFDDAQKLKEQE